MSTTIDKAARKQLYARPKISLASIRVCAYRLCMAIHWTRPERIRKLAEARTAAKIKAAKISRKREAAA
jgi:hypothetical protein